MFFGEKRQYFSKIVTTNFLLIKSISTYNIRETLGRVKPKARRDMLVLSTSSPHDDLKEAEHCWLLFSGSNTKYESLDKVIGN